MAELTSSTASTSRQLPSSSARSMPSAPSHNASGPRMANRYTSSRKEDSCSQAARRPCSDHLVASRMRPGRRGKWPISSAMESHAGPGSGGGTANPLILPYRGVGPGAEPAKTRQLAGLLLAQGLDRVQLGGLAGGVIAEEQARDDGERRRQAHDLAVEGHRQVAEAAHQQRSDHADRDADHATDQRDQHGLGQELPAHVRGPGADRHAQADLAD